MLYMYEDVSHLNANAKKWKQSKIIIDNSITMRRHNQLTPHIPTATPNLPTNPTHAHPPWLSSPTMLLKRVLFEYFLKLNAIDGFIRFMKNNRLVWYPMYMHPYVCAVVYIIVFIWLLLYIGLVNFNLFAELWDDFKIIHWGCVL